MTSRALALLALPLAGCAAIIGASFDDAGLAPNDASAPDVHDVTPVIDVVEPEEAAPFDPFAVPNLAFWISATSGVDTNADAGNVVTRWHDRSAFMRDAVPAGKGTNPPTLVPAALNGLPVVHFNAAQLDLLQSSWAGPGGSEITIFLVARGYPNSALRFQNTIDTTFYPALVFPYDAVSKPASPYFILFLGDSSTVAVGARVLGQTDGGVALASAAWHASAVLDTYDDGVLVEQRQGPGVTLPGGQTLYIGGALPLLASPNTTLPFTNGDIAEEIVYVAALDDMTRSKVEGYLRAKWGIP